MVEEHLKLFSKYEGYTPKSLVFREKINVSGEPKETVQPRFSYVISNQMVRNGKKMRRGSAKKSNAGSKKNSYGGKKTKSTNFDPVIPVNPLSQPQANAINDFSMPSKIKRRSLGRRSIAGNKRSVAGSKKISSGEKKTKLSMLNSASPVKSPSLLANDASNDFSIPGKSRRQSLGRRKMSRKPANV
jgi:hypothetical protein